MQPSTKVFFVTSFIGRNKNGFDQIFIAEFINCSWALGRGTVNFVCTLKNMLIAKQLTVAMEPCTN